MPYVHTFAVFIYRRPYDQLAMSIAYPNLPVKFVAFLPGITTPGGVTHQAIEDVAIMRATPNMTVLETADATEVESVLDVAHGVDGPVYIRMVRGEVPRLFPADEPMQLDTMRMLSDGDDIVIVTAGIGTEEAIRAAAPLATAGVGVRHLHVSTHKPLADPLLLASIERSRYGVVTLENHTIIGGLGSAVAEMMAEAGLGKKLLRLGLKDTYAHPRPSVPDEGVRPRCRSPRPRRRTVDRKIDGYHRRGPLRDTHRGHTQLGEGRGPLMIEPTRLDVSGERITATYVFTGPTEEVADRAAALCVEQTIELTRTSCRTTTSRPR